MQLTDFHDAVMFRACCRCIYPAVIIQIISWTFNKIAYIRIVTVLWFWFSIQVIIEKLPGAQVNDLDKRKFLIPSDISVSQLIWIIRKRVRIEAEKALFLYIGKTIPSARWDGLMSLRMISCMNTCNFHTCWNCNFKFIHWRVISCTSEMWVHNHCVFALFLYLFFIWNL